MPPCYRGLIWLGRMHRACGAHVRNDMMLKKNRENYQCAIPAILAGVGSCRNSHIIAKESSFGEKVIRRW